MKCKPIAHALSALLICTAGASAQDVIVIVVEGPIEEIVVTDDPGAAEVSYSMTLDEWLWMNGIGVWERLPNLPGLPAWPPVFGPSDDPPEEDPEDEPDCGEMWEGIVETTEWGLETLEEIEVLKERGIEVAFPSGGRYSTREPGAKATWGGDHPFTLGLIQDLEQSLKDLEKDMAEIEGAFEEAGCPWGGPPAKRK